jgi:hypothetical protein
MTYTLRGKILCLLCASAVGTGASACSGHDHRQGADLESGGGGDAGAEGGVTSGNGCQSIVVDNSRVTPNMLLVLDRSSSMKTGQVDRWDPSVNGIKKITQALQDEIDFGLMPFPGGGPAGVRCAAGDIQVPIATHNADAIAAKLATLQLNASTPTAVTIEAAHKALAPLAAPQIDGVTHPTYVILVTDGAPNCNNGRVSNEEDPVAVAATVSAIEAMAKDGIQTYVLAFGAENDPTLKNALDMMAVAGGTGDTQYHPLEDEASVEDTLRTIAGGVVSCSARLDKPVDDPSFVLVSLDGKPLNYNAPDGWSLGSDKRTLSVKGSACNTLKDTSKNHYLDVEVTCSPVPLF